MGVGSRAKKRRIPLKETSAAEIDDLRSTNEMPSGSLNILLNYAANLRSTLL